MITKLIKHLIFGKRCEPVDSISTGLRTMSYNQPLFEEWYQAGEPLYERRGEYDQVFSKSIYIKKHGSKQT